MEIIIEDNNYIDKNEVRELGFWIVLVSISFIIFSAIIYELYLNVHSWLYWFILALFFLLIAGIFFMLY